MAGVFSDLKYGVRQIARAPGAACVAMLALGLGVGANAAIFSIANGLLLHPLSYAGMARLMDVAEVAPHSQPTETNSVSPFNYLAWQQQARSFQAITAYRYLQFNLSGVGTPAMVQGTAVATNFFDVLPAHPLLGRTFLPEEGQPGRDREVILSQDLWRRQFNADPAIVGRSVELNQEAYTVVGIVGLDAAMPQAAEIWTPLALTPAQRNDRSDHYLHVIGELAPGTSVAAAQAEMRGVAARTDATYPLTNKGWGVYVQPLAQRVIGRDTSSYIFLLMGSVGFLLLIACANVANLQFARALGRNHELAIRTALGAGRWRLVRQLLNENIMFGLGGGAVGTGFAYVAIRLIKAYMPADVARFVGGWDHVQLDGAVLLYTLGIAVAAGIVAGLAPAWHASTPDLNSTLKEGGRGAVGHARRRLRAALVVLQVALALVLLIGAGLMVQGFNALLGVDRGYQPERTLTAGARLPQVPQYATPQERWTFYQQALDRLGALPGVAGAAMGDYLPLGNNLSTDSFSVEGQPVSDASQQRYAVEQSVSPNFIPMLGIPLLEGRQLTNADGPNAPPVVIVSAALARRVWPGRSALGEHIKDGDDNSTSPWMTVVGVVGDVKWAWGDPQIELTMYRPYGQSPNYATSFLLRGSGTGDVDGLAPAMRSAIAQIDPNQPLFNVMSLAESIHQASIGIAYVSVMLTVAGVLALVLAAIGVYGVMAFLVSERVHEFGVRRALGASNGEIAGLVLRRGGVLLAWGLALGLPLAYLLARSLQGLILGISAGDLTTYVGICLVLAVMALGACLVPLRQATRVSPLVALRQP